ncbi:MAG: DUF4105 domain-containing protein [Duncaniella sp.]|nr:DUF4105 domain-containing protein [Duncaniella sp.]
MRRISLFLTVLLTTLVSGAVPSDSLIVSLLTCRAGSDIYQLEGHSGLRIRYPQSGSDMTVNWGVFDFNSPNFVYRFVKGETDYLCAAYPTEHFLAEYRREGRTVVEQVLNLSPEEAEKLLQLASVNLMPSNRVYRYNYVYDNCATRPLALIEQAIGDTVALAAPSGDKVGPTFRSVMTSFHKNYPWYQFGIDTALGAGIDIPIDNRHLAFAPELLEEMMAGAVRPDGTPAVSETNVLLKGKPEGVILPPTPWWLTPMFWSIIITVICIGISVRQLRTSRLTTATRIADTLFFGVAGIEGLILTFLIFVSVHEATSPNWLYLWLNPLCLLGTVGVWIKNIKRLVIYYQIVNFALLIAMTVIFVSGVQKPNPAFVPLLVADATLALPWFTSLRK